jgi:hypothetical protein
MAMKPRTLKMTDGLARRARARARRLRKTFGEYLRCLVEADLESENRAKAA